jgi:ParB-like chromosome segregation protein Spo0J
MTIESLPISSLSPDPANARVHSTRNLDAIKASLRRFGQQKPIVVDARNIVRAGNGTLAAAIALGWTHINIVRTDLMSSDAAAYAIADNRTSDLSDWDEEALARQLDELRAEGMNLADIGFDTREVRKLLEEADPGTPDDISGASSLQDQWLVVVTCKDEPDQIAFLEQMKRENRECKALLG